MKKTTLYLPDDLKADITIIADREGRSEADVIRDALRACVAERTPPKPTVPLLTARELKDPTIAERVDELLDGFGR